jgi:N-acetyl sugar amidotransferase
MTTERNSGYQICSRCVMDTSDPEITFDAHGQCSWCQRFDETIRHQWFPGPDGDTRFSAIAQSIKAERRGQEYDCIIGLSGGIDSSYTAYIARQKWNLKVLAVHVDAGWNSELAVKNIENVVKKLGIDLHTEVIDWDEIRDLQIAFLRSGVANLDIPQDHVFFAALYRCAVDKGIRHVLSGGNIATESVLPAAWGYNAMDLRHLRSIHRRYGSIPLSTYPTCNFFQYYLYYPIVRRMRVIRPLNFAPYVKHEALAVLEKELGYRYYGAKHGESRFTKFFQGFWLPTRFGYDKRRAHLSSQILSGQTQRQEALRELAGSAYRPDELKEDRAFVIKKLGITEEEFVRYLNAPLRSFRDYPSNERLFSAKDAVRPLLYRMGMRRMTK